MDICVDFDGTCVTHEFPNIGVDIGAQRVLKRIIDEGHNIILFTMRGNLERVNSTSEDIHKESGDYLSPAIKWFSDNGIPLYGINKNPTQASWTNSEKAYGNLYIDDAALGCPLIYNSSISERPFVDWIQVEAELDAMGII